MTPTRPSDIGRLRGYEDARPTGSLYGRHSFGNFRAWLFSDAGVAHAKRVVADDLSSLNLSAPDLTDMTVLDIGTGRQALAFHLLGAAAVDHFDISEEHVGFFQRYIAENGLPNLTSSLADVTQTPLPQGRYDFVYLNGIVQHFDSTESGLKNLAQATRPGGLLWLYFYRSGSFKRFVVEMLRELVDASDLERVLDAACAQYGCGPEEKIIGQIMDDFFVPFARLFSPDQIIDTMRLLGFVPASSQKVDPLGIYDHQRTHHSSIIVFRKIADVNHSATVTPVRRPVSQLRDIAYREALVNQNIQAFDAVRAFVNERRTDRGAVVRLCLDLHRISSPTYYPDGKPVLGDPAFFADGDIKLANHEELHRTLREFLANQGSGFSN